MPIAKKVLFKCQNCGYEETRTIGDVLPDKEILRPCPKCGARMVMTPSDRSDAFVDKIKDMFK